MRNSFFGYYKDEEISQVLCRNKVVIVLDPLVLCNLYGLHEEDWKPVIELLKRKEDSFWLPYNMALFYHQNIRSSLLQKIQLIVSIKNRIKQSLDLLNTLPYASENADHFRLSSKKISIELTKEIAKIRQKGKRDCEIRDAIADLYEKRIGQSDNDPDAHSYKIKNYIQATEIDALSGPPSPASDEISVEPLYSDKNDVILHTLIKLSTDKNKDVIFVTSEPSEYWSLFIGKTSYGPNPERQLYFYKNTSGHNLYCCPFASFMSHLASSLGEVLPQEIRANLNKLSYGSITQSGESELYD